MTNNEGLYKSLRNKLEKAGFVFEMEQKPFFQNRENEMKFIHPLLVKKLKNEGLNSRGKKFYIKSLTDEAKSEVGLVTGKSTPLISRFQKPNALDSYDNSPAWVNRNKDNSLDILLNQISEYILPK